MACRNCEYYDPEELECTLKGGYRDPDGEETQGCSCWEPVSEQEEERREELLGCIIMFLLLPFLLIMKIV